MSKKIQLDIGDGIVGGSLELPELTASDAEEVVNEAVDTETVENLRFFEMFSPKAKAQIITDAEVLYDEWTDNVLESLVPYGGDAVQNLNDITNRLLEEVEPVDIPKVDELTRQLVDNMANLKKYDIRQKKVLDGIQQLGKQSRKLFRKPDNYASSVLEAARGERAVIEGLLNELNVEFQRMIRNANFLEDMYQSTNNESLKLIYHLAVLERVRLLASKDAEELGQSDKKIDDTDEAQTDIGDLSAFMKVLDMKIDGLRTRLVNSTQSAPDIREMHLTMVGLAQTLWSLEQLAVPGMKGTLLRWIFQATAIQAGHLKTLAANTVQDWMIAGAEASAENIPAAMAVAFEPIMTEEAIEKITELQQKKNAGILDVINQSREKLENAGASLQKQRLIAEKAEVDIADAVDPEMKERMMRLAGN